VKRAVAHLRYFAADALDEWRHSPGVNLLATSTLCAALFVAALVMLVLANVGGQLDRWRDDLRAHVYLQPGVARGDLETIRAKLEAMPEVDRVVYVDQAEALKRFRESFGDNLSGPAGELETNPLPASFEVYLSPEHDASAAARDVTAGMTGLAGIEEVRFDQEWLDRLGSVLRLARAGGLGLSALVLSAVVLMMASVLRLAVYARRDEIDIMQLVGATTGFVRGPFVVAGLAQGLVAAVAALALVEVVRRATLLYAGPAPVAVLGLVAGHGLGPSLSAMIVALGLLISAAGAYFAVRRTI
jgi:cell division transport system permease protein